MKLLLFTIVVCFAAALAVPTDKQKRDILPGDPRYGTEHDHHHGNENEVQPQQTYGPPSHVPGKPLGTDFFATSDADKTPSVLVPATSYGIPDTTQIFTNLLGSVDDKNSAAIKTTIQEHPKFDIVHVQKTAIPEHPTGVHKHVETASQTVSLPQVKVTTSHLPTETQGVSSLFSSINTFPSYASYSSYNNIPLKTVDHHLQVQVPHPYQVPVTKHVPVPVAIPHTVEIPKPYYVRVPQPVQVTVDRPYPVEIPRPVPYPVHHYVKTSVPVAHPVAHAVAHPVAHPIVHPIAHHVTVDTKANPVQTFFDNSQLTFQNVLSNLPTFSSPLEGFQNPFENFELPSLPFVPPSFPSLPSVPFLPQQPAPVSVPSSISSDSVTVDNPALKVETITVKPFKPAVVQPSKQAYKPSTACAGCIVSSATSNKQEYVQPTDANGGYVY
ncbi:PREDICTED: anti-sigma-I factor RsgI2-like [Cyphomyrmex costatus]|uniref:anti-sigma-I factor RsgI2-like n=1 Tax=Cyphomyrmex costatus TaxID=456900 RepID=UPI000852408E|nr:PREDICTED: anti-sigma-I factor RsgI2-like [Cyphomyrmex costatus]